MSHTKFAFAALVGLTGSGDYGPAWFRLIVAVAHLTTIVYLAWYVFAAPEVVERKKTRR